MHIHIYIHIYIYTYMFKYYIFVQEETWKHELVEYRPYRSFPILHYTTLHYTILHYTIYTIPCLAEADDTLTIHGVTRQQRERLRDLLRVGFKLLGIVWSNIANGTVVTHVQYHMFWNHPFETSQRLRAAGLDTMAKVAVFKFIVRVVVQHKHTINTT